MNSQNKLTKEYHLSVSWQGVFLILIGIAVVAIFGMRASQHLSGASIDSMTKGMNTAAAEMSKLESRSGTSVAEAYYQAHGQYLVSEAKVMNEIGLNSRSVAFATNAMCAVGGVILVLVGTRMKKVSR